MKIFNANEFEVKISKIIALCFIYLVHIFHSAALVKFISTHTHHTHKHIFLKKDFQEHREIIIVMIQRVVLQPYFNSLLYACFMTACLKVYCLFKGPLIVPHKMVENCLQVNVLSSNTKYKNGFQLLRFNWFED